MTPEEYKQLSIKEFTRAARIYDSDHAGIYEMCKHDYPPVLAELEKESFHDVLDCGCGTGPMIQLLHEKYPDRRYVGLDLTPEMIHVAQAKQLSNTEFLVGDSENLPFAEASFDAVICSNSFHHYPCAPKRRPSDSAGLYFFRSCCLAHEPSGTASEQSVRARRCESV